MLCPVASLTASAASAAAAVETSAETAVATNSHADAGQMVAFDERARGER